MVGLEVERGVGGMERSISRGEVGNVCIAFSTFFSNSSAVILDSPL